MADKKTDITFEEAIELVSSDSAKELFSRLRQERDDYKNALEVNSKQAQAIIQEKSILVSVLVEKISNMTRQ